MIRARRLAFGDIAEGVEAMIRGGFKVPEDNLEGEASYDDLNEELRLMTANMMSVVADNAPGLEENFHVVENLRNKVSL